MDVVISSDRPLTEAEVEAVARHGAPISLDRECLERLGAVRAHVDELAAGDVPA